MVEDVVWPSDTRYLLGAQTGIASDAAGLVRLGSSRLGHHLDI